VIWTNKDGALHTVESGSNQTPDGKFGVKSDNSPILIPPGKTSEFKPTAAGDYPYFCSLHPAMVGMLKVAAAGGSTGGTSGSTGGTTMQQGTVTANLDGKSYTVTSKSATSKVTAVTINKGQSVTVSFDKAGDVELTLPKAMISGIQNTATTPSNQTVTITPVNSTSTDATIKFTVPSGATTVNIKGAMVVPEFGVIAALVLAASLVTVIGVARFKGQAFGFRL
jgi:predicted secreted protein with PEFG-CTERM motif